MHEPAPIAGPFRRRGGACWRRAALGIGLAYAALQGGCVHAPRQASESVQTPPGSSPPASPAVDRQVIPTVSVDLNRSVGENTTFHKTATERQKFQVHIDFGKVFESQGNLDRALQEYRDALKVAEARGHGALNAGDEALAHRRIASALDRLGQFGQSESHYQKARKLAPRDPRVWNDAGYSYYLQGRWQDAERSLRTAMKLAPDDPKVRTNLGLVLGAAGKTAEALPLLGGNQGDAIGHANLGYLLASTGHYPEARREYQAAVAMRPDLFLAQRALAQLDRQEQGSTKPPAAAIASNVKAPEAGRPPRTDPQVSRTSAPGLIDVPPPLPPLPPSSDTRP